MAPKTPAKRARSPDVGAQALTLALQKYCEATPDATVFRFAAYENKGRTKAPHAQALVQHSALLKDLILASEGHARIKPKQLKASVLNSLTSSSYAHRRLNHSELPADLFADRVQITLSIMLNHLRRLKYQECKRTVACSRLNEDEQAILLGLLDCICVDSGHDTADLDDSPPEESTPPTKPAKTQQLSQAKTAPPSTPPPKSFKHPLPKNNTNNRPTTDFPGRRQWMAHGSGRTTLQPLLKVQTPSKRPCQTMTC